MSTLVVAVTVKANVLLPPARRLGWISYFHPLHMQFLALAHRKLGLRWPPSLLQLFTHHWKLQQCTIMVIYLDHKPQGTIPFPLLVEEAQLMRWRRL